MSSAHILSVPHFSGRKLFVCIESQTSEELHSTSGSSGGRFSPLLVIAYLHDSFISERGTRETENSSKLPIGND